MFFTSLSSLINYNQNFLLGIFQLVKIIYVLNFSINFFYYSLPGTLFRSQVFNLKKK
jgi:hypothetical protein